MHKSHHNVENFNDDQMSQAECAMQAEVVWVKGVRKLDTGSLLLAV